MPDARAPGFRVVAGRPWRRGEQVFISYADDASSDTFLQLYGFVEPANPAERHLVDVGAALPAEQQRDCALSRVGVRARCSCGSRAGSTS